MRYGGLIELGVVFAAVLGIGVVELVALRFDRRRAAQRGDGAKASAASETAASPEPTDE